MALVFKRARGGEAGARVGEKSERKYNILYVEDEDPNWLVAQHSLKEKYNLERACNSYEAFEMLRRKSFDMVLMDIHLLGSELDGIQITEALRGRNQTKLPAHASGVTRPDLPVIFVTAHGARYTRENLVTVGGTDLITKPVNFINLTLAIARILSKEV